MILNKKLLIITAVIMLLVLSFFFRTRNNESEEAADAEYEELDQSSNNENGRKPGTEKKLSADSEVKQETHEETKNVHEEILEAEDTEISEKGATKSGTDIEEVATEFLSIWYEYDESNTDTRVERLKSYVSTDFLGVFENALLSSETEESDESVKVSSSIADMDIYRITENENHVEVVCRLDIISKIGKNKVEYSLLVVLELKPETSGKYVVTSQNTYNIESNN